MTKYEYIFEIVKNLGYPEYRYGQILNAIFKRKINRFDDMNLLPVALRRALTAAFGEGAVSFTNIKHSVSGQADKALFAFPDGCAAETVALDYKKGWSSFCVSSQCGCACGCKFCATGGMGFKRNLSADEITDQLLYFLHAGKSLDSVSFMGMGEPLLNPDVFTALSILTSPKLFGLSQRRITLSTVGIAPQIRRMSELFPNVNLAFSLHAPTDELRQSIMPINGRYGISDVFAALDEHIEKTNRKVFIAYVMLGGINDGDAEARELSRLLKKHGKYKPLYHIDIIPYNKAAKSFLSSDKSRVAKFREILARAGISASVRTQFGAEINAACGQLAAGSIT